VARAKSTSGAGARRTFGPAGTAGTGEHETAAVTTSKLAESATRERARVLFI
jgi:hypothetical protein